MCYSLLRFICKDLPPPAASPGCDRHFSRADFGNGIGAAQVCMAAHDPRFARRADHSIHLFNGRVVEGKRGQDA
jgi:hypothetical protein